MFKLSLLCVVITALFYNGLIFVVNRGDIRNPNIPFALKVLKDLVIFVVFFLPVLSNHTRKELKIPKTLCFYILLPVTTSLFMIAIALVKYDIDSRLVGILKNYLVYYSWPVVLALVTHHYKGERYFFDVFRLSMFVVLLLGLLLHFVAREDMVFTYSGRMISSLGNPNCLGYLSLLYILVLFGFMYHQSENSRVISTELIIAHIGLFLSLSYAALLCYGVILLIMFTIWNMKVVAENRRLIELIIRAAGGCVIGCSAVFLTQFYNRGVLGVAFEEKIRPLVSGNVMNLDSFRVRATTFCMYTAELFSSFKSFLFGTFRTEGYVETDSAFLNLAYNFGIPVFIAWLAFFIIPVCFTVVSLKKIKVSQDFNAAMTFMLSIFIVSSVAVHFWIQYLPEKFPTCLFIGFTLSYILTNGLHLKQSEKIACAISNKNDGVSSGSQQDRFCRSSGTK